MIAPTQSSQTYSLTDYFDLDTTADTRHEYLNGTIVPMTGGTPNHNRIIRNLCTALTLGLRGQPCEVFVADQRLWIPQRRIATYPDVMVIEGALAYQSGRRDTVTNPVLIAEVLSQSTRDYDQGDKFAAYRTLPSFREYILIDQYGYQVAHYAKTGNKKWTFQEYDSPDEAIALVTCSCQLPLLELYDKVEFERIEPTELTTD